MHYDNGCNRAKRCIGPPLPKNDCSEQIHPRDSDLAESWSIRPERNSQLLVGSSRAGPYARGCSHVKIWRDSNAGSVRMVGHSERAPYTPLGGGIRAGTMRVHRPSPGGTSFRVGPSSASSPRPHQHARGVGSANHLATFCKSLTLTPMKRTKGSASQSVQNREVSGIAVSVRHG